MKRFIAGAFATALLATGLAMAAPASAHTEVCVGQGTASTPPVYYPTHGGSASGNVTFTFTTGGCLFGGSATSNGAFAAGVTPVGNFCGHSEGTVTVSGDAYVWVSAGSVLVLTGSHGAGVVNAVPNPATGQSCTTGATDFLVTGAVLSV